MTTALVTGAASGIGAATARRLTKDGMTVVVADIDLEGARVVAEDVGGQPLHVDVTDAPSVREAFARAEAAAGPVDVLVNNAGGAGVALFVDTDPEGWDADLARNLRGAIACTAAVLPGMLGRRRGAIVNVASEAGRMGMVGGAVYAAAKAGVIGFTKAIAREAAGAGVRCNAVAPGPVDTPLLEGVTAQGGALGARVRSLMVQSSAMRRCGAPEEVAAAIAFLASDDASYVTGETLAVSGGVSMV
jgi:2-hydroxycyclohexanecarboxyl-CoA dehydrogenase